MDLDKKREHLLVFEAEKPEEPFHEAFKKDDAGLDRAGGNTGVLSLSIQGDDDEDKRYQECREDKNDGRFADDITTLCQGPRSKSIAGRSFLLKISGRCFQIRVRRYKGGRTTPFSVMIALTSSMGVASKA